MKQNKFFKKTFMYHYYDQEVKNCFFGKFQYTKLSLNIEMTL